LHGRLATTVTALPALPAAWRRSWRRRDHFLVCATPATAAHAAAKNGKQDKTTDSGADTDDDGFVVIDPRRNLATDRGASAASVLAPATTTALGTVEEVLLQTVALVGREFGGAASNHARGRVASIGVVACGVRTHDRFALLVARSTLAGGALKAIATAVTIWSVVVSWADSTVARAGFLWIAVA